MAASPNRLYGTLLFLTLCGLAVSVWFATQGPNYPPEVRAFRDKHNQIRLEMSEAEVDALLADYSSDRLSAKLEYDRQGNELSRPSTVTKYYNHKENPIEHDYFIIVYLDESGYVV